jgi:hypothetical protein
MGDVDMEVVHGIPSLVDARVILPSYHPAAGLHNTELSALVAYDFMQAAAVIRGEIEPAGIVEDEYPEPAYAIGSKPYLFASMPLSVDTEGVPSNPWGFSFTQDPGQAWVMRHHWEGRDWSRSRIVFHNSMYDLGMLRAMGIQVKDDQFDDTMILAYLLCVEPQGLKALAKRHCGMDMQSYDDVIGDAGLRHAEDYFVKVTEWLSKTSNSELLGLSAITPKRKRVRTSANAGRRSGKTYRTSARR